MLIWLSWGTRFIYLQGICSKGVDDACTYAVVQHVMADIDGGDTIEVDNIT